MPAGFCGLGPLTKLAVTSALKASPVSISAFSTLRIDVRQAGVQFYGERQIQRLRSEEISGIAVAIC
jgi:hypothetical protein